MGDVAEQELWENSVGYPRSKYDGILSRKRGKRFKLQRFTEGQNVKGVMFYLYDKGFKNSEAAHLVIREYAGFAALTLPVKRPIVFICVAIQKDFPTFIKWFNERGYNKSKKC